MSEKELHKICSNCGSENDSQNTTCDTCGALLEDSKNERIDNKQNSNVPEKKPEEKTVANNKKNNKKKDFHQKENNGEKTINSTKLIYLVGFLVILGVILIFISGVFEEPKYVPNTSVNVPDDHNHSGADLSAVQKINDMEQALKANPNDYNILLNLAHLLNDSGFYDRAIVKYKEYLGAKPNDADVLVDLGVCYYSLQDYLNAEKNMKEALKVSPKHQIAHFNLGIVAVSQNKNSEAINYWNKAIEINSASEIAIKAKDLIKQYQ